VVMPHHFLSTNLSFCISLTCIKWSCSVSYLFIQYVSNNVTHKVEQVISLFITTLIWGQMSFQHWLHLPTLNLVFIGYWCTVYLFAILIFNIYPGNDVSVKTYLGYVGLGWQMYLCLITLECIRLCSAGKKTCTYGTVVYSTINSSQ